MEIWVLVLAVVLWAAAVAWTRRSEEVEQRLTAGTTKLRPAEPVPAKAGNWKSGDKLWVMPEACVQHVGACPGPRRASDVKRSGVIAPFGGAEEMVKDLKEKVFPAKPVHFLAVNKDGKQVRVL